MRHALSSVILLEPGRKTFVSSRFWMTNVGRAVFLGKRGFRLVLARVSLGFPRRQGPRVCN